MEITIGIRQSNRELNIESEMTADDVYSKVSAAVADGTPLRLEESNGRTVIVPAGAIAYVEVASAQTRRVGFSF
ncbi:MAG: DUF3107 domain-containing protein [Ancrocorticia sp.]|jgi:hypothetical protein|nr:DUF3107 domain-containing protein [Ancrocorticia sp.]MCI1963158.1 DUF3107 domain-containing protein [Ancrocorticia sp.]MCI2001526.1 DUF3107 domain-containing protein [Ancrocorticia sp.]MCI2030018.1 DUF3107 domain-containing protein [Ancrocorticia sp.]MCI2178641.1 DUF3107 domain-containing protein [Ancrocorticia sp.]